MIVTMKNKILLLSLLMVLMAPLQTLAQKVNEWEPAAITETSDSTQNVKAKSTPKVPGVLKVGFGPAWVISKMYVSSNEYYKDQGGYEMMVNFEDFGDSYWGFSADLNFNSTSYKNVADISLLHMGCGVLFGGVMGRHWRLTLGMGLGVSIYWEKTDTNGYPYYYTYDKSSEVGLGLLSRVSLDYMFNDSWGIGIDLNRSIAFMKDYSGISKSNNEISGIARMAIMLGVRKYI